MWCIAPERPPHARHVAVEFVHPVIVGKRALPAVAVDAAGLAAALRASVRAGDVLLAVGQATEAQVIDLMQRGRAWGLTTIWLGAGPRPRPGTADHVLWVDDDDPFVSFSGRLVLLYHLLWELTHVCFEHPGLLHSQPAACVDDVCITCSDEGRVGEVIGVNADQVAIVRTADGNEGVDVSLVAPVSPGDLVLVHAGTALTRLTDGGA